MNIPTLTFLHRVFILVKHNSEPRQPPVGKPANIQIITGGRKRTGRDRRRRS